MSAPAEERNFSADIRGNFLADNRARLTGNRANRFANLRFRRGGFLRFEDAHGVGADGYDVIDRNTMQWNLIPRRFTESPAVNVCVVFAAAELGGAERRANLVFFARFGEGREHGQIAAAAHAFFEQRADGFRKVAPDVEGHGKFERPFRIGLDHRCQFRPTHFCQFEPFCHERRFFISRSRLEALRPIVEAGECFFANRSFPGGVGGEE
jgi:hypothetical protein